MFQFLTFILLLCLAFIIVFNANTNVNVSGKRIRNSNPFNIRDHANNFVRKSVRISCFDPISAPPTDDEMKMLKELLDMQEELENELFKPRDRASDASHHDGNDFDVYVDDYLIPMRDGIRLFTQLEVPVANGSYGLVMKRTPYGTGLPGGYLPTYAEGVQDVRGCWDSEGLFNYYRNDGDDGYDTYQWIENMNFDWFNGNIFLIGASADSAAICTSILKAPPQVKGMFELVGTFDGHKSNYYGDLGYVNGIAQSGPFRTELMGFWLSAINHRVLGEVHENESESEWWNPIRGEDFVDNLTIPAIHYAGWYDVVQEGTIDTFMASQYKCLPQFRGQQFLVVSPNGHCTDTYHPNRTTNLAYQLADELLREINEPGYESPLLATTPAITFYLMGPNETPTDGNYWVQVGDWPSFNYTNYYLSPSSILSTSLPTSPSDSRSFYFDPANPVPTIGGANLIAGCGPQDQRPADERDDVLTFTTAVLTESVYVVGNVTATIFVSTDAPDTDFTVKLSDVYADGYVQIICDGIARMKWRNSETTPSNPETGVTYMVTINMWRTAYVFNPGHQIRVSISSSNFPRFKVNPNNGLLVADEENAPSIIAFNTLQTNSQYPSRITLPIVSQVSQNLQPSQQMDKFLMQSY